MEIIIFIVVQLLALVCIIDFWKRRGGTFIGKVVLSILIWTSSPISVILYALLVKFKPTRMSSSSSGYDNSYDSSYDNSYDSSSNYSSGSSYSDYDSSSYDSSNDYSDSYEYWKSFSSLHEFCDYLNSHEEYEWIDELSSIIEWNEWIDQTDYPDRICSDGSSFIMYDSDNYKYVVIYDGY